MFFFKYIMDKQYGETEWRRYNDLSLGRSWGGCSWSVLAKSRTLTDPCLAEEGTRTVSRGARVAVCSAAYLLGFLSSHLRVSLLPGGHAYRAHTRLTLAHGEVACWWGNRYFIPSRSKEDTSGGESSFLFRTRRLNFVFQNHPLFYLINLRIWQLKRYLFNSWKRV